MSSFAGADLAQSEREALLFSRCLVGREPPPALVQRYVEACRTLFDSVPASAERRVMAFVLRHRWCLPNVDAAAGLLRPDSLLRRKILVMAAILETSTVFVDEFLPRKTSRTGLVGLLALAGLLSVAKLAVGIPLLWLAERADD